jgi:plasmid stabilization system protein ParE
MARPVALIWTAPALDDLDDIAAFIALDDAPAAADLVGRLLAAVERLRRFPASGRSVPELPGRVYRELITPPCRVIYRREGAKVLIVHVVRRERQLNRRRLRPERR